MHAESSSKKRAFEQTDRDGQEQDQNSSQKVTKLHHIFTKTTVSESVSSQQSSSSSFQWISPSLGPKRTCLHGTNLIPPSLPKVAAFDLDGTIIKSSFGKGSKKGPSGSWEWWRASIPAKLKRVHQEGFSIVIISNQALKSAQLAEWKKKIPLIAAALPDVPFRLFAATAKDQYRKPMPGMWYELERIFNIENVQIDKAASFFVGDAAGRSTDFSSSDRKWAINVGIPFFTPEEYFLHLPAVPYKLPGFRVSSLKPLPPVLPTSKPILPLPSKNSKPEIVLFVGYPSLGKSTFFRRHFKPAGYAHVNQDTLGTRAKCVKAVEEALEKGVSCVVDNTNRDKQTRRYYLDTAKKMGAEVRCFVFCGSMDLAWHNNLYRAFNQPPEIAEKDPKRELVPYMAFTSFRGAYEEPEVDEGFTEIRTVNWVFEGSEEERRRWNMWLQIDGK